MEESSTGLVVASNRGPVSWLRLESGPPEPRRGFGGLVTAVGGALQREPGMWVSVALSDTDAEVAAAHRDKPFTIEVDASRFRLRLLDVGERYEAYYNEVSNRLLWFTTHQLWSEPYEPTGVGWQATFDDGYASVNVDVAEEVAEAAANGGEVFLQDYHLCLAPRLVRDTVPHAPILHYVHTPWAPPEYLRRLPDPLSRRLLRGMLGADVVAFSSATWSAAFRRCAEVVLGARCDGEVVTYEGRRTVVADFVLGVDADNLATSAASPEARQAGEDIDNERAGRQLLLRVDRTDLSKNILRGLCAYELLLERHPQHRGKVWHYAHLNPSRQGVPAYRRYVAACQEVAERIKERFGDDCLTVFVGDDHPRAVAALERYDVLLANPVADGTNLVAKEGPVLNRRDGVLVLGDNTGAADVLGDGPLLVNAYDVEEQAAALHRALEMDADERRQRAEQLHVKARLGAPEDWFAAQRHVLREAVAARR